jgi:hypothetical protein
MRKKDSAESKIPDRFDLRAYWHPNLEEQTGIKNPKSLVFRQLLSH